MTIEELYGKILADEKLKEEFAEAVKEKRVVEWTAAQGVEATEEELFAYARSLAEEQELTDEQLDELGASGGYLTELVCSVVTLSACWW